ncbi:liver-expressed antimicrobial peptide 2-like [Carcharodon carcharias]|uniref:liver-expressed antimicrobial peptide 2-like n=1 Tax=Carcharodon carcharias TaxID=13397 RepID=UPI001B7EB70F|nr:liver-expressed antimicrobial peptide 2-like [Carcharodon carcharias]
MWNIPCSILVIFLLILHLLDYEYYGVDLCFMSWQHHLYYVKNADCAALGQVETVLQRVRRMTPLWRWMTYRPLGSSCRDNDECGSKYCREKRCSLVVHED